MMLSFFCVQIQIRGMGSASRTLTGLANQCIGQTSLVLERVYTTLVLAMAIRVFVSVGAMTAVRSATVAALQVVDGGEHEVRAVEVEVFGIESGGRIGLGNGAAFHASIVSSKGRCGEGLQAMGRIKG
jgi:hypothetical protein